MTRRRPAAPGVRPPRDEIIAPRWCTVCGDGFVLDRRDHPWSRAETCSPPCAKRLANRGRHSGTCRHCDMVEGYHLARDADVRRIEVSGQDEDDRAVTFRTWLRRFEWTPWDEPAAG